MSERELATKISRNTCRHDWSSQGGKLKSKPPKSTPATMSFSNWSQAWL